MGESGRFLKTVHGSVVIDYFLQQLSIIGGILGGCRYVGSKAEYFYISAQVRVGAPDKTKKNL